MLRLALIGCTNETAVYPRLVSRLRGGCFTAVVDPDLRLAGCIALSLDAAIWSDRFDKLLSEHAASFDAAVIHCRSRFDLPLCQCVAAAGKHLLVESPLALSSTVARDIRDACSAAGVRLMMGQSGRYLPSLQVVQESLRSGRLGEPGLLRIHRWAELDLHEQSPSPAALPPAVIDDLDVTCWLFGQRPSVVYAVGRHPLQPEMPQYLQTHLGYSAGGMVLIDWARTLPPGGDYYSLSLIGSKGAAYADDHHNMQLHFGNGGVAARKTGQGDSHRLALLQEFVNAIAADREPAISGTDGLRALEVAEAVAESLATGRALNWAGEQYRMVDS